MFFLLLLLLLLLHRYTTINSTTRPKRLLFSLPSTPPHFQMKKILLSKMCYFNNTLCYVGLDFMFKKFQKKIHASAIPAFKKQKRQTFLLLCKHYNFTTSTCSQFTHSSRREKNILYFSKDPFLQGRSFILHILHIAVIIIFLLVQLYLL